MFDPKTATVEAIKAMAFDTIKEIDRLRANLEVLNNELANRSAKEKLDKVEGDAKS